ncbi:DUF551 domain-containing protein [Enterobacteriaceae bacterium 4M9]|nr:DUF551 domain-containing protein [Enterobacteriaceae bacterium 4M9]
MAWISVSERLPDPFVKVWLMTDTGRRVTGYLKGNGEWHVLCRKVAAERPTITEWEES